MHGSASMSRSVAVLALLGAAPPAVAQVEVGSASGMRRLVPVGQLEQAAGEQYAQLLAQAKAQRALAGAGDPQLMQLRAIAQRLIPLA